MYTFVTQTVWSKGDAKIRQSRLVPQVSVLHVDAKESRAFPIISKNSTNGCGLYAGWHGICMMVHKVSIHRPGLSPKRLLVFRFSLTPAFLQCMSEQTSRTVNVYNCRLPDESDIQCAADLAAYFSKARGEGKCPVTQVLVKDLKKPPGAPPGMVLLAGRESVVLARPNESLAARQGPLLKE